MDRDVVAKLPGFFREGSDGDHLEGPSGEHTDELGGLVVVQQTADHIATEDLGHLDVEVLDCPELDGRRGPQPGSKCLALGGVLEDIDTGGGVENVPARHRSVGVSLLREDFSGRPVANDPGQPVPACPPFGERLGIGGGGHLDGRIVHG